jgi:DNA-directed RNA polymerase specialized sigma24 family protein
MSTDNTTETDARIDRVYPDTVDSFPETVGHESIRLVGVDYAGIGWYYDHAENLTMYRGYYPVGEEFNVTPRDDHEPIPVPWFETKDEAEWKENDPDETIQFDEQYVAEVKDPEESDPIVETDEGRFVEIATEGAARRIGLEEEPPAFPFEAIGAEADHPFQYFDPEDTVVHPVEELKKQTRFGMALWFADELGEGIGVLTYDQAHVYALRRFDFSRSETGAILGKAVSTVDSLYQTAREKSSDATYHARTIDEWTEPTRIE